MRVVDRIIGEDKLLEKGKKCLKNKEYDESIKYFNRVLKINPENTSARYCQGIALIKQKDYSYAINQFNKLLEKHPMHKKVLEAKAYACKEINEFKEADNCYKKILEIKEHSDDLTILNKRRNVLEELIEYMGEYGRADKEEIKIKTNDIIDCCNKILKITSEKVSYEKDEKIITIEKDTQKMKDKYISKLAND